MWRGCHLRCSSTQRTGKGRITTTMPMCIFGIIAQRTPGRWRIYHLPLPEFAVRRRRRAGTMATVGKGHSGCVSQGDIEALEAGAALGEVPGPMHGGLEHALRLTPLPCEVIII